MTFPLSGKKNFPLLIIFLTHLFTVPIVAQSPQQLERLVELAADLKLQKQKDKIEAIRRAQELGLPIRKEFDDGKVMEIMAFQDDQPLYYVTDNVNAAKTVSTNHIQSGGSTGYNLSGSTDTLGIWDGGIVRSTHDEFFAGQVIDGDGGSLSNHGTHVGGTMVANGAVASAKGMSPNAHLISYDWNSDYAEMAAAAAAGLNISNHSYGYIRGWDLDGTWSWYGNSSISTTEDYLFGFYDYYAALVDQIANNAPYYLIVKSAGNDRNDVDPSAGPSDPEQDGGTDGYDCIAHFGLSKNILTVGAVNDITAGYSVPGDVSMSSFSCWGPVDDGRIKPDIVGNGITLYSSLAGSDSQYGTYSGTSMSSPNIAGSLGLLLEQQRNYYGDVVFRASTLKGLLLHTADEAGTNDGPDYVFGWGLANFKTAAELIEESAEHCLNISEYTLSNGETIEFPVVKDDSSPLKVTIAWNDPYGTPVSASLNPTDIMLVNDLDLRIIDADGTEYQPWVLDPSNPSAAATTADNDVDNIEQVFIDDASEKLYTVRISHKGSLQGGSDQVVSVIVSGNKSLGSGGTGTEVVSADTVTSEKAYWAHQTLRTDSTSFMVNSGGNVIFTSGENITLHPGFYAAAGSDFHAYLNSDLACSAGSFSLREEGTYVNANVVYERNLLEGGLTGHFTKNIPELMLSESEQADIPAFLISPNPSDGLIQLHFEEEIAEVLEVYSSQGSLLLSFKALSDAYYQTLDMRNYPSGVYYIKAYFAGGARAEKLVIQ